MKTGAAFAVPVFYVILNFRSFYNFQARPQALSRRFEGQKEIMLSFECSCPALYRRFEVFIAGGRISAQPPISLSC